MRDRPAPGVQRAGTTSRIEGSISTAISPSPNEQNSPTRVPNTAAFPNATSRRAPAAPVAFRGVARQLSGWGCYPVVESEVHRPERLSALRSLVHSSERLIARGLGRSYGDAAVARHGRTVLTERLDRFLQFDARTGILECEAGVTIDALIDHCLPLGFFPSVVPGTKHVTLGGAIAADVHGKNHHVAGAFSQHVISFRLLTASGAELECSRESNTDVFWATVGGMGLTGIITDVRLALSPVPSPWVSVHYERAANLDDALERFHNDDHRYAFSVAWIDCLARGGSLGRAVLMRGDFAPNEARSARRRNENALPSGRARLTIPGNAPQWALATPLMRAFNAGYYHLHPGAPRTKIVSYEPFFFPLDKVRNWNRLYGRRGFLQYQCVLPYAGGREGLIRILEMISSHGAASFLAVLKRFGEGEPGQLLSFPRSGYTLALDLPNRGTEVFELLERLDELVVRAGGRVYLAKDARMRPETFRAMYPEFGAWLRIKNDVDPEWRFTSEMAARLGLMA